MRQVDIYTIDGCKMIRNNTGCITIRTTATHQRDRTYLNQKPSSRGRLGRPRVPWKSDCLTRPLELSYSLCRFLPSMYVYCNKVKWKYIHKYISKFRCRTWDRSIWYVSLVWVTILPYGHRQLWYLKVIKPGVLLLTSWRILIADCWLHFLSGHSLSIIWQGHMWNWCGTCVDSIVMLIMNDFFLALI